MSKASEGELGGLHGIVARYLAEKIASGEATASDVSNAIKLLKDNNITCDVNEDNDLGKLQRALDEKSAGKPVDDTDLAAALEQIDFSQGTGVN